MTTRDQAKFLAVLYAVPTVLFAGVVAVHQTGPTVAAATHRAAMGVAESTQDFAEVAATHASTMVSGGAASIGKKRWVVKDSGQRMKFTYGDWVNEKDRAKRERVNQGRPMPKWLSHPWDHWEEEKDDE